MNSYLTLFTFLRMMILGGYLIIEARNQDISDYMHVNWLNWPSVTNKAAVKEKIKQCATWDSFRINIYSISLLIACEFLNCLGNIWVYYVCLNFGILENLLSMIKGIAIVFVAVPLCLDICYTLLQKVNPYQLVYLLEDKLKTISYIDGVVNIK